MDVVTRILDNLGRRAYESASPPLWIVIPVLVVLGFVLLAVIQVAGIVTRAL